MNRAEPVAGFAAVDVVSRRDRALRFAERVVEWALLSAQRGVLGARRASKLINAGDVERGLLWCRVIKREHDAAPSIIALVQYYEALAFEYFGPSTAGSAALERINVQDLPRAARAHALSLQAHKARIRRDFVAMHELAVAATNVQNTLETGFHLAIAEKSLGHVDAAIGRLDSLLDSAPRHALLLLSRAGYGVLIGEHGARELVKEVLEDATLERPDEATWLMNQVWIAGVLGDVDMATRALRELIAKADPRVLPAFRKYFDCEPDLDELRARSPFAELLASLDQ